MDTKITSELKRIEEGNIEITYTIPANLVLQTKEEVVKELGKDMTIAGFRKGMAPVSKVESSVPQDKLNEHILSHILPSAFADSVKEEHLKPAMYPKFEAIKIGQGSDWEIKAITCELPEVNLKDYKKRFKSKTVDEAIKELPELIALKIPQLLVDEEVNERLSQLLARIEKLGLQLEGYLRSVGKTVEELRNEYQKQSSDAISLELILNEIANVEKVEVSEKEIDDFIKTTGSDSSKISDEQRKMLKRVVIRRKALEKITK
ncbi:MAG TPA: trigger factor [Patescibacteria group bacterium]|nr:trigger factor [Patescibacteria group bacterium]